MSKKCEVNEEVKEKICDYRDCKKPIEKGHGYLIIGMKGTGTEVITKYGHVFCVIRSILKQELDLKLGVTHYQHYALRIKDCIDNALIDY